MVKTIEYTDDDPGGTPTWTEIAEFTDNFERPTEEPQTWQNGRKVTKQNGSVCRGSFEAIGGTLPTPTGGPYWFRFTDVDGQVSLVGGTDGCSVTSAKAGVTNEAGVPFTKISYSCSGAANSLITNS